MGKQRLRDTRKLETRANLRMTQAAKPGSNLDLSDASLVQNQFQQTRELRPLSGHAGCCPGGSISRMISSLLRIFKNDELKRGTS